MFLFLTLNKFYILLWCFHCWLWTSNSSWVLKLFCNTHAKKTWSIMKVLIGKIKLRSSNLPRRITVNKVDIFDEREIANEFNAFLTNNGSKLASKIPKASTTFESYISKPDSIMETKQPSMNELKDAFFSLKININSRLWWHQF